MSESLKGVGALMFVVTLGVDVLMQDVLQLELADGPRNTILASYVLSLATVGLGFLGRPSQSAVRTV